MVKNFPKSDGKYQSLNPEVLAHTASRIHAERAMYRHIIVKLLKIKGKEKIFKVLQPESQKYQSVIQISI